MRRRPRSVAASTPPPAAAATTPSDLNDKQRSVTPSDCIDLARDDDGRNQLINGKNMYISPCFVRHLISSTVVNIYASRSENFVGASMKLTLVQL